MRLLTSEPSQWNDLLNTFELFLPQLCAVPTQLMPGSAASPTPIVMEAQYNLFLHPHLGLGGLHALHGLAAENMTLAQATHAAVQQRSLLLVRLAEPTLAAAQTVSLTISYNLCWSITHIFVSFYIVMLLWLSCTHVSGQAQTFIPRTAQAVRQLLYSWIALSNDKVETVEEAVVLLILWPWCFLIIFSHIMTAADHSLMFGFAEWGLPVTYGLIMLLEHAWAMGTFLVVYLAGATGRKSSLVAAAEDAVALIILIARVCLQAIRGVIVGMFHFISRELIWNMSAHWTHNSLLSSSISVQADQLTRRAPLLQLATDIILSGSSFVVITAVMFLQLLFLLVSVWLFCKCWFISWRKC